MKRLFRNANIGVAVGAVLLFGGTILFHGDADACSATTVGAIVACFGTMFWLDCRDERARDRDGHRSS